jgi:hypothetical protein
MKHGERYMSDGDTLETIEEINRKIARRFVSDKRRPRKPPLTLDEIEARFANSKAKATGEVHGAIIRGALARNRRRRTDARLPEPDTWLDLIRAGGPEVYMRAAGLRAARQAELHEARRWLAVLEDADPGDAQIAAAVAGYIKRLRRILGVRPPIDEVRAQTRERVRRFRAKSRARTPF